MSLTRLLVATGNAGKLREYREMMSDLPVEWLTLKDVGLGGMEVEETGDTFVANALIKAEAYSKASGLPTLADDSGIAVDALNGAPGVYSARYAPTEAECRAKLLGTVKDVPTELRTARFVCLIAMVVPDVVTMYTEGRVEGAISYEERGTNGFGYDPIFLLPDGRTMAELGSDEKNSISHRGRALKKLQPLITALVLGR
jgi:XTP/dITP diphosphohydrolase